MEQVLVVAVRLGGEVVPHEALDRVVVGLDRRLLVRLRDDGREHLEADSEEPLVLRRVDALDGEAKQAFGVCVLGVDGERNRVRSGDGEDLKAVRLLLT